MHIRSYLLPGAVVVGLSFFISSPTSAAIDDCHSGYIFKPNTGVGCVQENCNSIPDAHYSYVGDCICGTSGSINEKDTDPNKECSYGSDYESCPGCVYACVHLDENCPEDVLPVSAPVTNATAPDISSPPVTPPAATTTAPTTTPPPATTASNPQPSLPLSSTNTIPTESSANVRSCEKECAKLTNGGTYDEVLSASGTYPNCKCTVDNRNKDAQLTETVVLDGDKKTTYIYDPKTNELIKKNTISVMAERERIRESLGVKYSEEEIDQLLDSGKIDDWFKTKMSGIKTNSSALTPAFWWQHVVALLDHGYGNSADFVDTYNFGRCGDSMQWLERDLAAHIGLDGKKGSKNEAMLSITGENYGNFTNHTALMIRPAGFSNIEWMDIVNQLTAKAGSGGMSAKDIENIDPRLLDVKVLDPYFKKTMTVRDFVKGWSVIRMS